MNFLTDKNLFNKAKSLLSSLYGIMLTIPTLVQISKQYHYFSSENGLRTLIRPHDPVNHKFIIHSIKKISPLSPSPPSSSLSSTTSSSLSTLFQSVPDSCPTLDDLIGTESGVYLHSDEEEIIGKEMKKLNKGKRIISEENFMKKDYPPPIPSLARTGNLAAHLPWKLSRHYCNGRLILTQEKLERHEYFESQRENGRLILKLVRLDDNIASYSYSISNDDDEFDFNDDLEFNEDEEMIMNERLSSSLPKSYMRNGNERQGDLRKCLSFTGKMLSDYCLSCNVNGDEGHIDTNMSLNVLSMATPSVVLV